MNKELVIVDGNHLAYRAYYKFARMKNLDGEGTAIIYGVPFILRSLINKLGPDKVLVAFDGKKSGYRLGLLPGYKDRPKRAGFDFEDFHSQKTVAIQVLVELGIDIVYHPEHEADDLIAMIVRRYKKKNWDITIVSGDKDFNQLVDGQVSIWNPGKQMKITEKNMLRKVGYYPYQCVDYLTLLGDDSDNIPGYPGIGEKRAKEFLENFSSIKEFINSDSSYSKIDKTKLEELRRLNKRLIDLNLFYRKFLKKMSIPISHKGENIIGIEKLTAIAGRYEINLFNKPEFTRTFKQLRYGK